MAGEGFDRVERGNVIPEGLETGVADRDGVPVILRVANGEGEHAEGRWGEGCFKRFGGVSSGGEGRCEGEGGGGGWGGGGEDGGGDDVAWGDGVGRGGEGGVAEECGKMVSEGWARGVVGVEVADGRGSEAGFGVLWAGGVEEAG